MEKSERKKLVKELALKVSARKELENKETTPYKMKLSFNKKYLSKDQEHMLEALKDFLNMYPNLSKQEVMEVLSANKKMFQFLIDCEAKYFDFFESVKNSLGLLKHKIAQDKKFDEMLSKKLP